MLNPWSWFTRKKHPVLAANQAAFRHFDQSRPVASYDFVVFDTELTGLNPRRDEIVSIGAVRIRSLRLSAGENFHVYVRPRRELPKNSTLIHQITPQQIENAPLLPEVLPDFVKFCNGALLVGHYVGLDIGFVNRAAKTCMGGKLANPCVDTMRLAQVFKEERWGNFYDQFNYGVSYNLRDLAREYDLPVFDRHDALQDALQTAYLFLFLVKKLRSGGITTLRELYLAGRSWRWVF